MGSAIKEGLGGLNQYLGNQTASAINTLKSGGSGNFPTTNQTNVPLGVLMAEQNKPNVNQTYNPNAQIGGKPAYIGEDGKAIVYGQGGKIDDFATLSANSGSLNSKGQNVPSNYQPYSSNTVGGVRPSSYSAPAPTSTNQTWKPTVDSSGRQSNSQQGQQYVDAKGNVVTPKQGFSGLSGGGGEGFYLASQGMQGDPGGGGSAFTGLLGASGTSAASQSGATLTEEEKAANKKNTQVLTPQVSPTTAGAINALTANPQSKFSAPPVPETIDAGWLSEVQKTISGVAGAGTTMSANERSVIIGQLSNNLIAAKQKLDQQTAMPENPIVDTQEQLDFINNQQDPFGVRQAIDQFKMEQTNLGQLQGTRVELMKNVQALNEAYKPIIDDIKHNPDLPKGLARRRLEDLATTQKTTLQGFLDQLEIVGQQISDQNESVNRNFQIVTFSSNQQNQYQDNLRANLQMMINSGAIAGFSTKDINSYAQAIGISPDALIRAKSDALKPKTDQSVIGTSETGYYSVVTNKETGAVVSKTLVIPGTPKSTTTTESTNSVGAWGGLIDEAISKGGDVNSAVDYAIQEAYNRNVKLSTAEISSLRAYAQKKKGATPPPASDPISSLLFKPSQGSSLGGSNPFNLKSNTQTSTPAFISKKK